VKPSFLVGSIVEPPRPLEPTAAGPSESNKRGSLEDVATSTGSILKAT
jgi:hypothetical protein